MMTRIRVTFWSLVVATILTAGVLTRALEAPPSTAVGATVAISGLAAALAGGLAVRIAVVVARHRDDGTRGSLPSRERGRRRPSAADARHALESPTSTAPTS